MEKDRFIPLREDYADFCVPVEQCFDWGIIWEQLGLNRFKQISLFVFRSVLKELADISTLDILDDGAFHAAEESDGFISYVPYPNMSFCLWESIDHAKKAVQHQDHIEAANAAATTYSIAQFSWYTLKLLNGNVSFIPESSEVRSFN